MKSPIQQHSGTSDKTTSSPGDPVSDTTQHLIEYIDVFCNESLEGIIVLDHHKRILYLNPAANAIFSSSNQDCLGQAIWHAFPDLADNFKRKFDIALSDSGSSLIKGEYPSLRKSLAIRVKRSALNIFIFVQDITHAADTAQHDTDQTNLLNSIIANMFDGVIVIDMEGSILSFNPAAENMTGFKSNELIGQSVNLLMGSEMAEKHNAYLTMFKSNREHDVMGRRHSIYLQRKDKSNFPVEIALIKIELEGQIRFINIIHDIRARTEQEKKIKDLMEEQTQELQHVRDEDNHANATKGLISEYLSVAGEEVDDPGTEAAGSIMQNADDTVLISTLLEDEPDLVDLIEVFLEQLPSYIERCKTQFAKQDWASLADTLHSLVGMAGGYGYPIITDTARLAENELKKQNYEHIAEHLHELEKLNGMAQRGYQKS